MTSINWCCKQRNGIKLAEPNENLSKEYLKTSDDDLKEAEKGGKWGTIAAYYACYEALYAILQKIGIKCEIHECSIALMKIIPGFTKQQIKYIEELKRERTGVQYYLEKPQPINLTKVKEFILDCKEISDKINEDAIKSVREQIRK